MLTQISCWDGETWPRIPCTVIMVSVTINWCSVWTPIFPTSSQPICQPSRGKLWVKFSPNIWMHYIPPGRLSSNQKQVKRWDEHYVTKCHVWSNTTTRVKMYTIRGTTTRDGWDQPRFLRKTEKSFSCGMAAVFYKFHQTGWWGESRLPHLSLTNLIFLQNPPAFRQHMKTNDPESLGNQAGFINRRTWTSRMTVISQMRIPEIRPISNLLQK